MSSPQRVVPRRAAPARLDALDGLRTIAVFLVAFFHVAMPGLSAGFAGVDVFFVLSGYLITSGLVREIQRSETIDLVSFWTRRLRRLMPAAMLVIVVVLVWAWTLAPVFRRPSLGGDSFMTVVYLANWHFMQAGSYFAADGTQSPLLHMWSLAVEEQFYLLWPLVLTVVIITVHRAGRTRRTLTWATGVCAAMLAFSAVLLPVLYGLSETPDRAYMGTDTKAFEPLLGALAALLVSRDGVEDWVRAHARAIGWSGLALAVGTFPFLSGPSAFYFRGGAFLFSLGTLGVLLGATRDPGWLPARALAVAPMAYLGRISYGIYLWHWPLAVWLGAHAAFRPLPALGVVVGTVSLASLSYHFYEQPILTGRLRPWFTTRRTLGVAAATMALVAVAAAPLGESPLTPAARAVMPRPALDSKGILFVGDSVPQRLMPVLSSVGTARGLTITAGTRGGCSPLGVAQRISPEDTVGDKCPSVRSEQADAAWANAPGTVVWWSRYEIADRYQGDTLLTAGTPAFWDQQLADLDVATDRLTAYGATLVVVLTEPPGKGMDTRCTPSDCHPFLRRMVTQDVLRLHWNELVRQRAAIDARIKVITVDDIACPRGPRPLCDDTLASPRTLARPDGSHFDVERAGDPIATAVITRALAAAGH